MVATKTTTVPQKKAAPTSAPAAAAKPAVHAQAASAAKPAPSIHSHSPAPKAPAVLAAPAAKKKKAPAVKKSGAVVERGKRKESVARAVIRKGKGIVRVNSMNVNALDNNFVRDIIIDSLRLAPEVAPIVDIDIEVFGGGQIGQAQACRTAIAKAIVAYTKDDALRIKLLEHDRTLLVEDSRRVEPKKYKGPKARARFQKSYR